MRYPFATAVKKLHKFTQHAPQDLHQDLPLFDAAFYRLTNPELEMLKDLDLFKHYNQKGWKTGCDPSALFSVYAYLNRNPDVAEAKMNPRDHYLKYGQKERRSAYLSRWRGRSVNSVSHSDFELCKDWLDIAALRTKYPQFKMQSDDTLIAWYIMDGCYHDTGPTAQFSALFYQKTYPDIARNGTSPLVHYVCFGQSEGRAATVSEYEGMAEKAKQVTSDLVTRNIDIVRSEFDADWYRESYPDVTGDDEDLLLDYMLTGWKEGRDPSPTFSTSYYLDKYKDIARHKINPFVHYIQYGRKEGRRSSDQGAIRLGYAADVRMDPDIPYTGVHKMSGSQPDPPSTVTPNCMDIHWVIPDFRAGSGGHMTVFRMVRYLEQCGHNNTIWIERPVHHETGREAWETIIKYFQCVEAEVRYIDETFQNAHGDVIIATAWNTAWAIKDLTGFAAKMYFVQDHEPEFYPTGAKAILARQTYDFDLGCICASPWLEDLMSKRYGRWARGFYLAYEPEQYFITDDQDKASDRPFKIAVYGRMHTDRRCVQLALAGLEILAQDRDDFEVHFFGQDTMPFKEAPFTAYNHGVLGSDELAALYNDCDLGICFSGTNYSLVPQEMMACGLPLVEFNTESTQAIFPAEAITLAGPMPVDIAEKINVLMDSPDMRECQRDAALAWVANFSWHRTAAKVEKTIIQYLEHKGAHLAAPAVTKTKDILFDVVVPTWNGKSEFEPVLGALRSQNMADQIQIHCVDSSSTDGTIDWLKGQRDVSLTVIDQKDFQHGRTRNFGASLGKAQLIGFITQDAMPATQNWATDIIKMMGAVPEAAGLFGRHIAYPNHSSFVKEEITNHFENMLKHPLVLSKHTDPERWENGDLGWRQLLHFYSDNNSAMRRDVWKDIPYPEVDYGEDQVWARDIIEAGFSKIYAPTATVYHSHDFDGPGTYKRAKTEGAFFYEFFGYTLGKGTVAEITDRIEREQRNMETRARQHNISDTEIALRKESIAEKYRGWRDGWMTADNG